jgi:CBS domain-containing protein
MNNKNKGRLSMNRKIKDVMTSDVQVIRPDCKISEAAEKMKAMDVGSLPVCDSDKLVGLVTDRDIAIRAVAEGTDPRTVPVSEIMTSPITYCFGDQEVGDVARIMEAKQIRRLVVLNKDKRLVGIVSLGDLAVKSGKIAGEILEKVSEPVRGQQPAPH